MRGKEKRCEDELNDYNCEIFLKRKGVQPEQKLALEMCAFLSGFSVAGWWDFCWIGSQQIKLYFKKYLVSFCIRQVKKKRGQEFVGERNHEQQNKMLITVSII